jgi:Prp8 binding protein
MVIIIIILNVYLIFNIKNLLRVAWSPDGLLVSAGSSDKFLYIWEAQTAKIAYKLPGHLGSVNDVDFHPNEPIIASGSSDRKVYLGEL